MDNLDLLFDRAVRHLLEDSTGPLQGSSSELHESLKTAARGLQTKVKKGSLVNQLRAWMGKGAAATKAFQQQLQLLIEQQSLFGLTITEDSGTITIVRTGPVSKVVDDPKFGKRK